MQHPSLRVALLATTPLFSPRPTPPIPCDCFPAPQKLSLGQVRYAFAIANVEEGAVPLVALTRAKVDIRGSDGDSDGGGLGSSYGDAAALIVVIKRVVID